MVSRSSEPGEIHWLRHCMSSCQGWESLKLENGFCCLASSFARESFSFVKRVYCGSGQVISAVSILHLILLSTRPCAEQNTQAHGSLRFQYRDLNNRDFEPNGVSLCLGCPLFLVESGSLQRIDVLDMLES